MTLQRRLERLESRINAADDRQLFVLIRSYEAGDGDANAAKGEVCKIVVVGNPGCPPQTFERLPGETEDELRNRASACRADWI